jgi:hypothetical protein
MFTLMTSLATGLSVVHVGGLGWVLLRIAGRSNGCDNNDVSHECLYFLI